MRRERERERENKIGFVFSLGVHKVTNDVRSIKAAAVGVIKSSSMFVKEAFTSRQVGNGVYLLNKN
jgi:hypothetical protein